MGGDANRFSRPEVLPLVSSCGDDCVLLKRLLVSYDDDDPSVGKATVR